MAVSRVETWDAMHEQHGDVREWYCGTEACAALCRDVLEATPGVVGTPPRVLHYGCGTSTLGVALADAHGCAVTNTDASAPAVRRMAARYPRHVWRVADARDAVAGGPYDLAVDKGVFDSVTAARDTRAAAGTRVAAAVHAALAAGGAWVIFSSFAPEEKDMRCLIEAAADWESVDCDAFGGAPLEIPGQDTLFAYVCRRRPAA